MTTTSEKSWCPKCHGERKAGEPARKPCACLREKKRPVPFVVIGGVKK